MWNSEFLTKALICELNLFSLFNTPILICRCLFRFKDHRRRCDRVREELAGRDHPDSLLAVCVRVVGPPDLYGGPHAKVHQELSAGGGRASALWKRVHRSVPCGVGQVQLKLQQLVLHREEEGRRSLRQRFRLRRLPRQLHLPPGVRAKPELRLHQLRHVQLVVPFGLQTHDPGLLGRALPGRPEDRGAVAHPVLPVYHLPRLLLPGQLDPGHRRHELRRAAEEGGGGRGSGVGRRGGAEGE